MSRPSLYFLLFTSSIMLLFNFRRSLQRRGATPRGPPSFVQRLTHCCQTSPPDKLLHRVEFIPSARCGSRPELRMPVPHLAEPPFTVAELRCHSFRIAQEARSDTTAGLPLPVMHNRAFLAARGCLGFTVGHSDQDDVPCCGSFKLDILLHVMSPIHHVDAHPVGCCHRRPPQGGVGDHDFRDALDAVGFALP